MFRKQAAEVADKIKAEVSKASDVVIAAVILAVTAIVLSVAAIVLGVRGRAGLRRAS